MLLLLLLLPIVDALTTMMMMMMLALALALCGRYALAMLAWYVGGGCGAVALAGPVVVEDLCGCGCGSTDDAFWIRLLVWLLFQIWWAAGILSLKDAVWLMITDFGAGFLLPSFS